MELSFYVIKVVNNLVFLVIKSYSCECSIPVGLHRKYTAYRNAGLPKKDETFMTRPKTFRILELSED